MYRTLGSKTFIIFLSDKTRISLIFLFITIGLSILAKSGVFTNISGQNFSPLINFAALASLAVFVIAFALAFFIAWLEYANYKFFLDEDSLKIKRGVLSKEEIAIPYRQIQNVDIERNFYYQMMGLSRLVILTAGYDADKPEEDESEGILPALDKNLAEWVRGELLKRTSVQKVVDTK